MKRIYILCGVIMLLLMTTTTAMAGTYETGVVEYRPRRTAGVWVIDKQAFFSTTGTRFDSRYGEITVRTCVDVDYYIRNELRYITNIQSVPQQECNPHDAHGNGMSRRDMPSRGQNQEAHNTADNDTERDEQSEDVSSQDNPWSAGNDSDDDDDYSYDSDDDD